MPIFDGDLDLAPNALQNNRDLLLDAYTTRALESSTPGKGKAKGTLAFPEMRRGRVAACFAVVCVRRTGRCAAHIDFGSPAQVCGIARGQLGYYRALESQGHVCVVTTWWQLEVHMERWQRWESETDSQKIHHRRRD